MKIQQAVKGTFLAIVCFSVYILTTAQYDNPSNGKTGGPGEGQCIECHQPSNNSFNGTLELSGIPNQVFAGNKYNVGITVRATQGNPFNAGIQMIAIDGNNFNIGELKNPRGISGVVQFGDRIYFEHKGSPTKFNDGVASWSVDWVAPETITNPEVNFYAATILGNGDSTAMGDLQILTSVTTTLIEGDPPLSAEPQITEITCGGAADGAISLEVVGGILPYSYLWNTGDSTSTISNLGPGTYTAIITDSDTSITSVEVTLEEPPQLFFNIESVSSLGCSGQNNAMATLSISGGNPPYLISWPDGDTSLVKENLGVGEHIVVATDNSGCSDTVLVVVEAMTNLQLNLVGINESAPNAGDGQAFISPEGGTPPYLIAWSDGTSTDTISNLLPGVYSVLVGDQSGCLVQDSVTIRAGVCSTPIEVSTTQIACSGDNNGGAMVMMPNDAVIESYAWSNGDTLRSTNNLGAGTYIIQIIDTMGCQGLDTIVIEEPEAITINIKSTSDASCDQPGSASFIVSGGTPPYDFTSPNLNNPSDSITDLEAGQYRLIVTDQNGCTDSIDITLSNVDNDPPILIRSEYTLYLNENGMTSLAEVPVDSLVFDACGVDSIWYSKVMFNCTEEATPIAVQAWDENLNRLNGAILINVLDTVAPTFIEPDTLRVNSCDSLSYQIPEFTDNCMIDTIFIQSGLPSGSVFPDGMNEVVFQARDISGNLTVGKLVIQVNIDLDYTFQKNNVDCPTDSAGFIIINADPALQYSYQWNTGLIGDTITNIPAGDYSVSITDTTGCTAIEVITVESSLYEIQIDTVISKNASGEGEIQITILGGESPYAYVWRLQESDLVVQGVEDLVNIYDGTYELEVTDGRGCTINSGPIIVSSETVSTQSIASIGLHVFPNPAQEFIRIDNPQRISIDQIQLIDYTGRISLQQNDSEIINIQPLASGIYWLVIESDGQHYYTRIVKR